MIRSVVTALILCACATVAAADSKTEARCAQFGQMSAELAALRMSGTSETDATLALADKYKGEPVEILRVIPVLSAWVFGLSPDDLNGDVAGAMTAQCIDAA